MLFYMTWVLFNYVLKLRAIFSSKQNCAEHTKILASSLHPPTHSAMPTP